jgi:putative transposase
LTPSVGKNHSLHLLGLQTKCESIDVKDTSYRSFGLRHQIPAQDIRCSGIGGAGGARSASLRQDGHILVEYPAKLSVSVLVNAFKGTSSRMLRRNRPDIASCYRDDVLWSPAYFAASVGGAPLAIIKQYVEQQGQPASSSPSSARLPRAENFVSFLRLMARSGDHWSSTFSRTTTGRVVRNTAP